MRRCSLSLLIAALAFAVAGQSPAHAEDSDPTDPLVTFSGGDTVFDISVAGNVIRFESPVGYGHLGHGNDGYVLCYRDPATAARRRAFDVGFDAGFTHTRTRTTDQGVVITRRTKDGLLRLRQWLSFDTATGALAVRMRVTNRTGGAIAGVSLQRWSDLDVDFFGDSGWWFDYGNAAFGLQWFETGGDAVRSWTEAVDAPPGKEAHTVALHGVQGARDARIVDSAEFPPRCNPPTLAPDGQPVEGDHAASLRGWFGVIPAGGSRQAIVTYRRL
jgi:hypothetical protein